MPRAQWLVLPRAPTQEGRTEETFKPYADAAYVLALSTFDAVHLVFYLHC